MKIAIDARMYGLEHAGLGRYVMSLIRQLEAIDKDNDYFILLRKKYFRELKFKNRRFKKVLADYPHYSLTEQLLLPIQLIKLKPDMVHFPHFNLPIFWQGKYVVTIHDLIKHESKGQRATTHRRPFYWLKYFVYKLVIWMAIKKATKIIVPCQWWKKEIISRYKISKEKIVVTYEGADIFSKESLAQDKEKVIKKYQIEKPFIIYTGSLYPHKNVESLVKAAKRLRLPLVIVCARSVFYQRFIEKIKKMKAERFVNFVGFVTRLKLLFYLLFLRDLA
jgi:glycosyltransferase involved in cell wall biosynthesis